MADFAKAALNIWCGKKKLKVNYEVTDVSRPGDNAPNFRCEITIDTISFVSTATAPNKKSANNQAALAMLAWLVNSKYLSRGELMDPCYTVLKIHEVLYPGGTPISMDGFQGYQTEKSKVQTPAPMKTMTGHVFSGQASSSSSNQNKEDWWNIDVDETSQHSPLPVIPKAAHIPPPFFGGPDIDMADPYNPVYWSSSLSTDSGLGVSTASLATTSSSESVRSSVASSMSTQSSNTGGGGNNSKNGSGRGNRTIVEWAGEGHPSNNRIRRYFNQEYPGPPPTQYPPRSRYKHPQTDQSHPHPHPHHRHQYPPPHFQYPPHPPPPNNGYSQYKAPLPDYQQHRPGTSANHNVQTLDFSKPNKSVLPPSEAEAGPGNFTLDNAKQLLNQFMQIHKIKAEYEFESQGPAHRKLFTARLSFFIPRYSREISVTEHAQSKMEASRLCALKVCQQLLSEGLMESFNPTAPSKRQLMKNNFIYEFLTSPTLKETMVSTFTLVQQYNATVNSGPYESTGNYSGGPGAANYFNPLASGSHQEHQENAPSYLYWCAPLNDFNPWTGSKPDDPVFTGMSTEAVNMYLQEQFQTMVKDPKFQSILATRMKLPIYCIKEQVIDLIDRNSVLIIKGSTGCGKTTQVPQFILDTALKQGNGAHCNIVVTQPRRISAISISERVAFERTETLSANKSSVGYSVRFDHIYPRPYGSVLFCTTGHLLRRIQSGLKGVSHLVIDEVHERDTNTDLLLVIVRDLIRMGLELKVIIMSATIGVQRFKSYFNNCHVLEIDGTLFPVQRYFLEDTIEIIKWRPTHISYVEEDKDVSVGRYGDELLRDPEAGPTDDLLMVYDNRTDKYSKNTQNLLKELREGVICFELVVAILEYIESMYVTGAVLIFLPGWAAIFELLNFLKAHKVFGDERRFLILPLHSQLAYRDNHKVFGKVSQRKIILSTNIAETSITIDDVVFVIDTCLLKRRIYCPKTNVTSYIVDWVSKSNILQRQGRAGRVRSGYFFILCTKRRFEALEEFKIPEILVSSLVETCLLIKYLGFGDVTDFLNRCIDCPSPRSIQEALANLRDINAFDGANNLTPLGTILVKLPIDPRLGRMVMLALLLGLAGPALTIAAASATAHELIDHSNSLAAAGRAMIKLDGGNANRISDHLIIYRIFSLFERQQTGATLPAEGGNYGSFADYRDVLNLNGIIQVQNARKQLSDTLIRIGYPAEAFDCKAIYSVAELDTLTGLLVTAYYPNICLHRDKRLITTNEGKAGIIHKGTVLYAYVQEGVVRTTTPLASPLFVYTEKSAMNGLITAKQMSMISHMQLLLLGVRQFEFPPTPPDAPPEAITDTILLDGWLDVLMDPQVFDCTWLVKTELENILTKVCHQPAMLGTLTPIELTVLNTVRAMCLMDNAAVKYHVNLTRP